MNDTIAVALILLIGGALKARDIKTGDLESELSRVQGVVDKWRAVRQLEGAWDTAAAATLPTPDELPSADELAAEVERFLRGQAD